MIGLIEVRLVLRESRIAAPLHRVIAAGEE
jgi:hypothetical protein